MRCPECNEVLDACTACLPDHEREHVATRGMLIQVRAAIAGWKGVSNVSPKTAQLWLDRIDDVLAGARRD